MTFVVSDVDVVYKKAVDMGLPIIGNDAARHTYESVDFKPYQTFHSDYFMKQFDIEFPGITKCGRRLN